MKKILTLSFSFIIMLLLITGCNNKKVDDTDINENTSYEMFSGNINKSWDEVKNDYNNVELEAKREINSLNTVTIDDLKEIENTIETKYQNLKNGITEDNEDDAKELYKAAIKIQELAKRNNNNKNHELIDLSNNAKSLIKHYYGEADDDFSNVKNSFEAGIENIKNYTEDKWQEFLNLIS